MIKQANESACSDEMRYQHEDHSNASICMMNAVGIEGTATTCSHLVFSLANGTYKKQKKSLIHLCIVFMLVMWHRFLALNSIEQALDSAMSDPRKHVIHFTAFYCT